MDSATAYIPMDRRQAMARGKDLPDRTSGAALFADISGFTPLTEALMMELGPRRGAEELTKQLNIVYSALIAELHRYGGSVIGFSGDAITCWLDGDDGLGATACALAMQRAMGRFAQVETRSGTIISLTIKVAVTTGPVRRFLVGDPQNQTIDVLAGATLDRMAEAEKLARKKEVVVGPEAMAQLGDRVKVLEWREDVETGRRFAVVAGLACQVEKAPWSTLPPSEGKVEALTEEQIRSWLSPPVYERLRTGQARFLAELRPAVALFLKFGGLDYDHDDAAGEKLDAYIRWAQNVLARYEDYLIQLTTGDKGSYLYAAFGAPLAHDDDPARAVAAAVELQSPPPEMDFVTAVQIGISRGRMRTGAYGSSMRCTYGVLGDEVNVAARLMGKAEPGQILVSKRVADAAAKSYRFEYLGQVELKGKEIPLPVYTPLGRRLPSPQRPATIFTSPLVGREGELAQMEQVLESVVGGEGQVLRLEGVAGIGKSHLVAEFIERAIGRSLRAALGACQSTSQGIAYYPWRQAFRALFELTEENGEWRVENGENLTSLTARQVGQVEAIVNDANPGWLLRLPLLGDLLGLPIPDNDTTAAFDPLLRQESLFALVVEIVQTWSDAQPLLLLVEDAQWMDEASLGLTMSLARAVARMPVLLALVHRPPLHEGKSQLPDLDRLPYYNLVTLRELTPQGIGALVNNRLKGELSVLALSLVQALAQGNPFFTEELVDALRESGGLCRQADGTWAPSERLFNDLRQANCLARENGHWVLAADAQLSAADLGIPDSIHGLVLSRIDRLPELHKLTIKVAGVVGRTFEFDLLAGSHPVHPGEEVLLEQIGVLEERDFTRLETPEPRLVYMFKHHITQEVVYQTLLEEQQRELHRAVGEALESSQPDAVERLAYHYSRSEVRDKTLFYLDKAARKTQREYANQMALNYYNQALALEGHWEWLKGKVEVLHILGERDDEQAGLRALEAASEAPVFDVTYLWGQYHEALGEYPQAQANVERALAVCRDLGDVMGEARCLNQLGAIAGRQGDFDRAEDWYNQALASLQDDEESQVLAGVLNDLGVAHAQQGRFDEARVCWQRALKLGRGSGNRMDEAQAHNNLGGLAFYQRNFTKALTHHQQALEIRRAIGDRAGEGTSLSNLAQVIRDAGDYGRAQEYLLEALDIQKAIGNRWMEANVWNELGILYLLLGDLPRAETCLQQGLELSQEIDDESGRAYVLCNLGQAKRDEGNLAAAERWLNESLALAQKWSDRHLESICLSHLGTVSLLIDRSDQAIERANAALAVRRELGLILWTTADLTTLAAAHLASGNIEAALDYARQALTILNECGGEGPEFPHRDYFICYQVLSAARQERMAHTALQSAYNLVLTQAKKITDPAMRGSFLEQVTVNREIVQEYANVKREA